ncbi:MAG: EamA family transporter [Treponema sp.]|nr:EamA family transporter [Candidatus Treponema scatequi]
MSWVILVLIYGIFKGARELTKKKAMSINSVMEVLVIYTFISFSMVIPQAPNAGGLEAKYYLLIALKSFAIFVAWICGFYSLKMLPVSLYGVLDLSRVLFSTFMGVVFLHEVLNGYQIAGLCIVCSGLLLLKFKPKFLKKKNSDCQNEILNSTISNSALTSIPQQTSISQPSPEIKNNDRISFFIVLALISCVLNAVSGFMDKVLMREITRPQLQFWYMVFLAGYYLLYILITRTKISLSVLKNVWVWVMALMFVLGDMALFEANKNPESRITMMTLIKQSGVIVAIIGGKIFFKEKNIGYKLFCAAVIIAGILIGLIR